ncbi:hypothetical protein [Bradyrhizobium sp. RD5-C2]|uniref:hypothetical protein n=1 Tax=Bradyrhizobium sp. RD5-C2 TaxID=244562 RepID=UPI001CC42BD2|nr:hypothetical protein [Bradyrhizobium sp. RD5-C2]GIQ78444.1 hypothetical protein BraRD5C2_68950 [Bradyrhizobium sp. RD5-C2]
MASVIEQQLKLGAKLHRESDRAELRMPDGGKFVIPSAWVDALVEERKLVAESDGFYRLA